MSGLFNRLVQQFGVTIGEEAPPIPTMDTTPPDPNAVYELDGAMVMSQRKEQLYAQAANNIQQDAASAASPVDENGAVNFDVLFQQAGIPTMEFTADQALDAIQNVEDSIGNDITDVVKRNNMIRRMLLAVNRTPAAAEKMVLDAHNKQHVLDQFVTDRGQTMVDFKSKGADAIRQLEARIEQIKTSITDVEKQYDALSANCKERRTTYQRVVDLFSDPNAAPSSSNPKP